MSYLKIKSPKSLIPTNFPEKKKRNMTVDLTPVPPHPISPWILKQLSYSSKERNAIYNNKTGFCNRGHALGLKEGFQISPYGSYRIRTGSIGGQMPRPDLM